jgi:putative transcriptional regulator
LIVSKAKRLIADYLNEIGRGTRPVIARRTEFIRQADGSILRRITRAGGTVEKEDRIPAEQWEVSAARAGTGLSQEEFARLLGVSKRTLQEWEQGRKRPSGAARVLLRIAARRPDLLREYTS